VTASSRSESGSTLIEVLVAVVILSLAVTAFLLGMTTSVGSSGISRDQAAGEAVLTSAGETVRDPNVNPYVCGDLSTVQSYTLTVPGPAQPPSPWRVRITDVKYWDPSRGALGTGKWKDISAPAFAACPPGGSPPFLQGLTITVTSPDREFTQSRMYVKVPPP
jgi:type II secretory pathway pseudopilin PulG